MAVSGSFKQQCPSCEAMVPIRDPALVGKKVDCPKCKYRFVVENPIAKDKKALAKKAADDDIEDVEEVLDVEPEEDVKPRSGGKKPPKRARDEEEFDDEDEAPKKKKKKKQEAAGLNPKLLIGAGLGLVAVIALGAAAFFLFFSGSGTPPPKNQVASNTPAKPVAVNPVANKTATGKQSGKTPSGQKGGKKGPLAKAKAGDNPAGEQPDVAPPPQPQGRGQGAPAGPENTNFLPNESEAVYHCFFKDFRDSPIGNIALTNPAAVNDELFKQKTGFSLRGVDDIVTAQSFSAGWTFNAIHTTERILDLRPLIQSLGLKELPNNPTKHKAYVIERNAGWLLSLAKMSLFAPSHALAEPQAKAQPVLLHMRNPQTIIVAHSAPMLQYLQANGNFPTNPPNRQSSGQPYLTLKPELRDLLIQMESKDPAGRAIISSATHLRSAMIGARAGEEPGRRRYRARPFWDVVNLLDESTDRIEYVGTAFAVRDATSYGFHNVLICNTAAESQQLQMDLHDYVGPQVKEFFNKAVEHKVDLLGLDGKLPAKVLSKQGAKAPPRSSFIRIANNNDTIDFTLDLMLTGEAINNMQKLVAMVAIGVRMEAGMELGQDLKFILAEAGANLGKKGQSFPPGLFRLPTSARPASHDPSNRVSWMAGLLPYMGQKHELVYSRIQFDKPWNAGDNWLAAHTIVPEFLDPSFPAYSRYVDYPAIPIPMAATHYVGISGVGIDAAESSGNDPAMAGKLGVFGYDRMTPFKTIAEKGRGLANTVLMVRVSPDAPAGVTPWMAGGGSTVRSVPDKNSLDPFLAPDAKGDLGTYVLMCDGSVRYIKKGMSDEVFKAICTVDGPTPAGWKFNEEYPPLKEPKEAPLPPLGKTPVPPGPGTGAVGGGTKAPPQVGAMPGWERYTSQDGFTYSMPAGAKSLDQTITENGVAKSIQLSLAADEQTKIAYVTAFFKIPPEDLKAGTERVLTDYLTGMMQGLNKNVDFKVVSDKKINFNKNSQGHEYVLKAQTPNGEVTNITRVYIFQDELVSLSILGPTLTADSQEARAYFNSLKQTKR